VPMKNIGVGMGMHTRRQWSVPALILSLAALLSPGRAQEKQASLSITLSAPRSIKAGAGVPLNIVVRNVSSGRIDFLRTTVAFDFSFDVKDSQGKEPSETQLYREIRGKVPHVSRFPMSRGDTWLEPGHTSEFSLDLTQLFELTEGKYTIQVSRLEGLHQYMSDQLPEPSGLVVRSNTIGLTVTP
jgi:hypothetical protein